MDIIAPSIQRQDQAGRTEFNISDNMKVRYRITEGNRERIQVFQGDVIRRPALRIAGRSPFGRMSFSIGVERTSPCTPRRSSASRWCVGRYARAKLFYLRKKVGKAAKIKEKASR